VRVRPWLGRGAWLAASTVVSLFLADRLLLRAVLIDCPPAYWLPWQVPHAQVVADVESVQARWTTNSLGFHDREHERHKAAGARRVVCLGDSFLDGPTQRPLPSVLEERLPHELRDGTDVDVVNLSAPSLGPGDYLALLRELAFDDEPDLVRAFVYVGNDFVGAEDFDADEFLRDDRLYAAPPRRSWLRTLLPRVTTVASFVPTRGMPTRWSVPDVGGRWTRLAAAGTPRRLAQYLTTYVDAPREKLLAHLERVLTPDELAQFAARPMRPQLLAFLVAQALHAPMRGLVASRVADFLPEDASLEVEIASVTKTLERMASLCAARRVGFGVVVVPLLVADPKARELVERIAGGRLPTLFERQQAMGAQLVARLRDTGVDVLELEPAFHAAPGGYLPFDMHWNEQGVATAADVLAPQLAADLRRAR
jgi:hypothetical protein